ncbi:MAG: HAD family phosphatase [Granulosicoccaceae bacterium]|jgi:putative hydrolase of the HAD superfamily
MHKHSIKAILFDFGGVLAEEGFRNGLMALAREQGLDAEAMPVTAMHAVYDSGFVLGQGTAEDFWALLRARTGLRGEDTALTRRILDGFVIRPWMIEYVRALRAQGYITGILSDQTHWLDWLDDKYHFSDAFDHIFNSYYLGKGKREPGLFKDVAATLTLPPSALLFVDDDAGNVARARKAGLQAIHYENRKDFIAGLARLGIVPD